MIIVFCTCVHRVLEAYFCFTYTRILIYPRSPCNFFIVVWSSLFVVPFALFCFIFKRFLIVNYNYNFNGKDRRGVTVLYF